MTDRLVRPVRAWADYDAWSVFLDHSDQLEAWSTVAVPKGAQRMVWHDEYYRGSIVAIIRDLEDASDYGLLRSLRVLYENGYELKASRREALPPRPGYINVTWYWHLFPPEIVDGYRVVGQVADGLFPEDKDSEAVERAMIAAAAFFTQADMELVT